MAIVINPLGLIKVEIVKKTKVEKVMIKIIMKFDLFPQSSTMIFSKKCSGFNLFLNQ